MTVKVKREGAQVSNKWHMILLCVISFLWWIHSSLTLQPAQGRQVRCQCHHQRAPSSLRQSDRQMDKGLQHQYDKATQTYGKPASHAVSLNIHSTDYITPGQFTLSAFVSQRSVSKIWNWLNIKKCVFHLLSAVIKILPYFSACLGQQCASQPNIHTRIHWWPCAHVQYDAESLTMHQESIQTPSLYVAAFCLNCLNSFFPLISLLQHSIMTKQKLIFKLKKKEKLKYSNLLL